MFDGDNPLSPCGTPYSFIALYQNILSDKERVKIIHDIHHHAGHYQLVRIYGLQNINMLVTLKQNVKVILCKLLFNLRGHQSSSKLFIQVEKESDPDSIILFTIGHLQELLSHNSMTNDEIMCLFTDMLSQTIPEVTYVKTYFSHYLVTQRFINTNHWVAVSWHEQNGRVRFLYADDLNSRST
jgi:hypothetical protein